jgi:hypothetical protein
MTQLSALLSTWDVLCKLMSYFEHTTCKKIKEKGKRVTIRQVNAGLQREHNTQIENSILRGVLIKIKCDLGARNIARQ